MRKRLLDFWWILSGGSTPSVESDAGDGVFHLGGDTPFYEDNTDSQAIWIQNN